jgi:hypothetical protein
MSITYQSVAYLIRTWPAIAGIVGFVILILGLLASNGYIDPAVHKSDIAIINNHISEVDRKLTDNRDEHHAMQTDIRSIMLSVGRIEGRFGVNEPRH